MKSLKSHFKFSKQERSGIFFLLLILVAFQIVRFFIRESSTNNDSLLLPDVETQEELDRLKKNRPKKDSLMIYPFNPNYITDFKGYTLGMSVEEIDRLHQFRANKKFVNSKEEFQKVTLVSDSLLQEIAPYFKFPDWVTEKKSFKNVKEKFQNKYDKNIGYTQKAAKKDLNSATVQELRKVSGIGEKLSARIVKFRDRLGGFLVKEQLFDVYGLEPDVVHRAFEVFEMQNPPDINKIFINSASAEELSKLVYITQSVAQSIVDYRDVNGSINSFDELSEIEDFPSDKIKRIALYLSLKK
ncbi:ComEA family DNA-binding protein [Maribacter sp. R77961]|uniref:ComEA family DNA-binding protein n=1 Tax=Maribacter sp. R77961 TaxID=3093871 RepID=UPI0037C4F65F